ncbi:hypothetical protein PYW08_011278 [Mythimna loreyi]|uniref:Uncharacterized protein n=1 Tax=Mythimna loreyi TaxID=667449 RepID=A0ACC2Q4T0_9NEOP|nr:hypothetical protein PYW08_011278 [Mythimna loreyi]
MSNKKKIEGKFGENNTTGDFDVNWDIEKYRDEHECEEHWQLRKAFMEKWKNNFPEERLICLARVYTNIEFMGCRYPAPVMQQIAQLSFEVGQKYKDQKKTKLQRTFVSASTAAEDRARGIKRVAGEIVSDTKPKSSHIAFVPQGQAPEQEIEERKSDDDEHKNNASDEETEMKNEPNTDQDTSTNEKKMSDQMHTDDYISEMSDIKCLDVRLFREDMFQTSFGRMVLLVRPWARKLWNIQTSCQVCGVNLTNGYENKVYSLCINQQLLAQATGETKVEARNATETIAWEVRYSLCINQQLLAQATGETKVEARNATETIAWERLRREVVSLLIKEQFIAQGDARISVSDVSGKKKDDVFGTPVENTVAMKMMKMMGWQGGGLGVDAQGISEPIKPNLQMVNRAGLGSAQDVRMLRRAAHSLMQRYIASDTFELDLVFTSDFAKEERAVLHHIAQKSGLASRSYGEGADRFLVVKKKLDPFSLVRAVVEKGGTTSKYQVFIPATLARNNRF